MSDNNPKEIFLRTLKDCEAGRKLGHVWEMIVRAAEVGWFESEDVEELLEHNLDFCVEELVFQPLPSVGKVLIKMVDDEDEVGYDELTSALKALQGGGEPPE